MILGIDIGTTTISFVVVDRNKIIKSITKQNDSYIDNGIQDANKIISICLNTYYEIIEEYNIEKIGISNQMHGLVYVDKDGNPISNLNTWQNQKGNELYKDTTYAKYASNITLYPLSTGFGLVTYFYDFINKSVPNKAYKLFTIGDLLAMKLCNLNIVKMHSSNAASFGLFNIKENCFDISAIVNLGLNASLLPEVSSAIECVGKTKEGIDVIIAVGDNQCSTYAVSKENGSLIINFGTGSQISYISNQYIERKDNYEIRPFINNNYLIVGCALCGGYSYQLIKDMFNSISDNKQFEYQDLNDLIKDVTDSNGIIFNTKFLGTRNNPNIQGSITGINPYNFKAKYIVYALLEGMVNELYSIYQEFKDNTNVTFFTGSGNGLIKNKKLIEIVERKFNMNIILSNIKEEAAYGAALLTELMI